MPTSLIQAGEVRILGDTVIVERDQNDKPLVDVLTQSGIPRGQIILTYMGEAIPELAYHS